MLHTMLFTSSAALAALTALNNMNAEGATVQALLGDMEPEIVALQAAHADTCLQAAEPDAYFTVHNTVWDVPDPRISLPFFSVMQGPDLAGATGRVQAPGDQLLELAEGLPVKANSVFTVRALHNFAGDKCVGIHLSYGDVYPITAGHSHRWLRLTSPNNIGAGAWAAGPTIAPGGTVSLPPDRNYLLTGGIARPVIAGTGLIACRVSAPGFHECRPAIPCVRQRLTSPWHTWGLWPEGMPFTGKETVTFEGWGSAAVGWEVYALVSETQRETESVPKKGGKLATVGGGISAPPGGAGAGGGLGGIIQAFTQR